MPSVGKRDLYQAMYINTYTYYKNLNLIFERVESCKSKKWIILLFSPFKNAFENG